MKKHNPNNERIKRKYLIFLKEAKRQSEASIDAVAKALSRFEDYNSHRDFKAFHFQQAIGFKNHLAKQKARLSGTTLSKATMNATLRNLKTFFQWLAMQSGYKSRINYTDTEYFNLSEKDVRVATAKRIKPVPTIEQIKHVITTMPTNNEIERRNRALIAFTLLTGARDRAIASIKLKHVDFVTDSVFQDAREVKTKFSKTFTTYFFPVGDEIRQIVFEWAQYLKEKLLFGNDDPLFPKTKVINGASKVFQSAGLKKEHWSTSTPIRTIFSDAFKLAGLDYFNPHSFRDTLARLGESLYLTREEFKSWSQNLGHESMLTTFCSYGEVPSHRQAEIFKQLKTPKAKATSDVDAIAEAVFQKLQDKKA